MQILLVTVGSHGDVHPFVGMGIALRQRGHQVLVATNDHFEPMIRAAGLDFAATSSGDGYLEALKNPELWHRTRGYKAVFEIGVLPVVEPIYRLIAERYKPGETVVVAHGIALGARVAQEKLGVPLVTVHLTPVVFRSRFDRPLMPGAGILQWAPRWMMPHLFRAADAMVLDRLIGRPLNKFRATLGLPAAKSIIGDWWMSPQRVLGLFPEWYAPSQPDWPPQTRLTGFPLFDEGMQTPLTPELLSFLDAGTPPIAFTFGSAMVHAEQHFSESVKACRQLNRRGLLLTRHTEQLPPDLPPTMLHVPYAPFGTLLPRIAALVHHGGIGTTAQALAAGVPQIICHFSHDQPDNGRRIERLGVGASIDAGKSRAPQLVNRLRELLDSQPVKEACQSTAARFTNADWLTRSCEIIEESNRRA